MRKVTLLGTLLAAMLLVGLMLVPAVGATSSKAPAFQATATVAATEAATTEATAAATEAATAEATAAATASTSATTTDTSAATATVAPGTLPTTGGDSGMSTILLGAAALFIIGIAAATLMASRRNVGS